LTAIALAVSLSVGGVVPALGSTVLNLTDTVVFNGSAYVVEPQSGTTTTTITAPASLSLGDAFNTSNPVFANFDSTAGSSEAWNFQDDYVFTVTGSSILEVAAIAFGPNAGGSANANGSYSGLTDLQARLIAASGNPAPTVGIPAGNILVDSWSPFVGNGISEAVTMPAAFAPGTYILQIRGEAVEPASYGGTITFEPAPVPLPPSAWLLMSGFASLGLLTGRRRSARSEVE
jgi:hypothetical protein